MQCRVLFNTYSAVECETAPRRPQTQCKLNYASFTQWMDSS